MRKIIIGRVAYDVIKYKSHLRRDEWSNCITCSIRIRMNIDDYLNLKAFAETDNSLNFNSVEDDGVYSCKNTVDTMIIMSNIKNDVICKFDLMIWEKSKLSKSESRDIMLDSVLSV
jgi:hypothetical protein